MDAMESTTVPLLIPSGRPIWDTNPSSARPDRKVKMPRKQLPSSAQRKIPNAKKRYFTPRNSIPHFPKNIFANDWHFRELPFDPYADWNGCMTVSFVNSLYRLPQEVKEQIYESLILTPTPSTHHVLHKPEFTLTPTRIICNKPSFPISLALRTFNTPKRTDDPNDQESFEEEQGGNGNMIWRYVEKKGHMEHFHYWENVIGFAHALVVADRRCILEGRGKGEGNVFGLELEAFVGWIWTNLRLDLRRPRENNELGQGSIHYFIRNSVAYQNLTHLTLTYHDPLNPTSIHHHMYMCTAVRTALHSLQTLKLTLDFTQKQLVKVIKEGKGFGPWYAVKYIKVQRKFVLDLKLQRELVCVGGKWRIKDPWEGMEMDERMAKVHGVLKKVEAWCYPFSLGGTVEEDDDDDEGEGGSEKDVGGNVDGVLMVKEDVEL